MPAVTSVAKLERAIREFAVADVNLVTQAAATAAVRQSLAESGLLLLGECHGVRENPLLIRALMKAFGLTCLALEWADDLAPVVDTFLSAGMLTNHRLLWSGDGRITVGHLAVLAERAEAGPLDVLLFDAGAISRRTWSQRDEAMAGCILSFAAASTPMLVVAGNAHTPTSVTPLGVPLGAHLARRLPGARDIRIRYGSGSYYNGRVCQFPAMSPLPGEILLHERDGALVLDLPVAMEAAVPHSARRWQPDCDSGPR
jgi:hypothetical protein